MINGKVLTPEGNKKIFLKFEDKNYSIKYCTNKIFLSDFIFEFNPP
jgi:hypothetical protein